MVEEGWEEGRGRKKGGGYLDYDLMPSPAGHLSSGSGASFSGLSGFSGGSGAAGGGKGVCFWRSVVGPWGACDVPAHRREMAWSSWKGGGKSGPLSVVHVRRDIGVRP